jgi:hypothetical protein
MVTAVNRTSRDGGVPDLWRMIIDFQDNGPQLTRDRLKHGQRTWIEREDVNVELPNRRHRLRPSFLIGGRSEYWKQMFSLM